MDNILKKGYGRVGAIPENTLKSVASEYGYSINRDKERLYATHIHYEDIELQWNTWFVIFNGVFKFVRNEEVAMLTVKRL